MRPPLDMDTVGSLSLDAETPEQQRRAVERLFAWAAEPHPADAVDITPAGLLAEAGQILELLGDHGAAVQAYRQAATAKGDVRPDVRCFLHRALVSVGDLPAARLLADEIRRSADADPGVYAMIGENYEKAGDLHEAHRWLNLALRRLGVEPEDGRSEHGLDLLLIAIVRGRIRRALELPTDAVDRVADVARPGRTGPARER